MIPGEVPPAGPGPQGRHASSRRAAPQEPAADSASGQFAGTSLRLQALEIIDSLLDSTQPELDAVRSRLRRHVKEHPGDPEIALLLHLRDRAQSVVSPWEVDIPPLHAAGGIQPTTLDPE